MTSDTDRCVVGKLEPGTVVGYGSKGDCKCEHGGHLLVYMDDAEERRNVCPEFVLAVDK
jgi:hypothetical protein